MYILRRTHRGQPRQEDKPVATVTFNKISNEHLPHRWCEIDQQQRCRNPKTYPETIGKCLIFGDEVDESQFSLRAYVWKWGKMPISWHGHCVLLPLDWTIKLRVPLKYSGTKPEKCIHIIFHTHDGSMVLLYMVTWILWDILWPRRKAERRHLRCCSPALWHPWNAPGVSGRLAWVSIRGRD